MLRIGSWPLCLKTGALPLSCVPPPLERKWKGASSLCWGLLCATWLGFAWIGVCFQYLTPVWPISLPRFHFSKLWKYPPIAQMNMYAAHAILAWFLLLPCNQEEVALGLVSQIRHELWDFLHTYRRTVRESNWTLMALSAWLKHSQKVHFYSAGFRSSGALGTCIWWGRPCIIKSEQLAVPRTWGKGAGQQPWVASAASSSCSPFLLARRRATSRYCLSENQVTP